MKKFESQEEYYKEKQELLRLFDKEGLLNLMYEDAMLRQCFELLLRDISPFEIIKRLIEDRQTLLKKIKELVELMPIKVIIPNQTYIE